MTSVVWKFTLPGPGTGPIDMPVGAKCLVAREQKGNVCLWALVDIDLQPTEKRWFSVVEAETAMVLDGAKYLGTAVFDGGDYVLHVFEVGMQ